MVTLLGAAEIRALAERLDVSPTKKWGQNFVHDANTVRKIVTAAKLHDGESVVEVGPGLGSLTLGLLEQGHPVTAIEIDPRLAAELPATAATHGVAQGMLTVIQADALAVTELPAAPVAKAAAATMSSPAEPTAIVANLPYNVSVPVLIHLLETFPTIRRILVMVQAEVGHRIAADPGSKVYGVPSVKAAWWGDWKVEGTVSRRVFWPEPNVDSVLVGMTARATPGDELLRRRTFAIADAAFGQRRKTLRQALSAIAGSTTAAAELCEAAGIDSGARGEQLTLADFVRLASVPF
ncbi:MAG: 16S rRNA (adenine(1518)-N(6)/adenine(1519)-N(6))-dimethyltransferase RsmA [Microbacteriaceae bacterium]|nr:16S rRNA (adenine(1518)-N(6)/adenine(1519)-N(6))-dimethyltransferase RsmA [Microbacteriaceae bacterium]